MSLPLFAAVEGKKKLRICEDYDPQADAVLFHGDVGALLSKMPDESVHLVVTSPPYNLGKEYEGKTSIETYLNTQSQIIDGLCRVLSPHGSICWQVGNYVQEAEVFPLDVFYYGIFKKKALQLRNRIIWHFEHGLHCSKRFSGRYETLLWFTKTEDYTFNLDSVHEHNNSRARNTSKGKRRAGIHVIHSARIRATIGATSHA